LHQLIKFIGVGERRIPKDVSKTYGRRVLAVIAILVLYTFLLVPVGYLYATFLLLCFLFRVLEKGKWVYTLRDAFLTSSISYVIFARCYNCSFQGVVDFFLEVPHSLDREVLLQTPLF